ncbi:MAG TPA: zf-HC2 domain-containing protein [Candidatus Baltobacteraceae bacterium]|nr:zf-HC2 domain-containing protein [Candidatus Baltobacteraceae bacterium]
MNAHIGENAELYAIGALDAADAREVETHVRTCEPCAQLLAEANEAVAAIEAGRGSVAPPSQLGRRLHESTRSHAAQHRWIFGLATAAALAIALVPTWVAVDRSRQIAAMNADEQALARIARAPSVQRAAFMSGGRSMGNVLYGKRGDWYYVVIMHPSPQMRVAYVHDGRREMLGKVVVHGASGTLYLPIDHRMNELALMDGDAVVADAHLAY